ncbi:hypothetical protein HPP92_000175 [Vanilla planifolia]|uniref:DUF1639 family protein n=1 Tax=Vanilla planifolia TaxID=51239 RepID=A0A835RPH8_VANPL|nr:hypothetical protein HPP92_000175 [Vanilla planifolia]
MDCERLEELGAAAWKKEEPSSSDRRISKSRLHNFSFPTASWGNQRLLRCMKPVMGNSGSGVGSEGPGSRPEDRNGKRESSSPESYFPIPLTKDAPIVKETGLASAASAEAAAAVRPWNLRSRKAAYHGHASAENGRTRYSPSHPQLGKEDQGKALLRSEIGEIGQRKKFFVSLSREEIEEDFYVFKGTKPCRRPKKRARIVERQLEALFPGLWLSEVTMDTYKLVD